MKFAEFAETKLEIGAHMFQRDEGKDLNTLLYPIIRRAAETPVHCIFQECMEPDKNVAGRRNPARST